LKSKKEMMRSIKFCRVEDFWIPFEEMKKPMLKKEKKRGMRTSIKGTVPFHHQQHNNPYTYRIIASPSHFTFTLLKSQIN